MEIEQAITAHFELKHKVSEYLTGTGDVVSADSMMETLTENLTALHQLAERKNFREADGKGNAPLLAGAGRFYAAVARLIETAENAVPITEEAAFGVASDYSRSSNMVITALMRIKMRNKLRSGHRSDNLAAQDPVTALGQSDAAQSATDAGQAFRTAARGGTATSSPGELRSN